MLFHYLLQLLLLFLLSYFFFLIYFYYFVGVCHICYTTPMSDSCIVNIFFHFVVCIFTSLCSLILTQSDLLVIFLNYFFTCVPLVILSSKWYFTMWERGQHLFFSHMDIQLIQHHLLKGHPSPLYCDIIFLINQGTI